jgi:hypothetical protein
MRIQEHLTSESESFIAEVEAGLGSINSADRDEMLDELRSHISQLLIEGEYETIREVLGEPKLYAIELIKASGFDVPAQQSRFQRLVKLQAGSKVLIGSISVVLVAALGIIAHDYQLRSFRQYEVSQSVAIDEYLVENFLNMPVTDVVEILTHEAIPLCSPTNLREGSLENLKVVNQSPLPGNVLTRGGQCMWLFVAPNKSAVESNKFPAPNNS